MTYFGLNKVAEALSSLIVSVFGGMSVCYTVRTICLVTIALFLRDRKTVTFAVIETDFSQSINSTRYHAGDEVKGCGLQDGQVDISVEEEYNL